MAKQNKESQKSKVVEREDDEDVISLDIQPFLTPISILLGSVIISIALLVGLNGVDGGGDSVADATPPAPVEEEFPETTVSIDDDPYLGNKETAKVAIVEFSDYNCSFCQRHHQQVHSQLVEKFVESGDAILVYRDFPGVGGQTTADAANATACAREQIGNNQFFDLIKQMYESTEAKDVALVDSLVDQYGVDRNAYDSCVADGKYNEEVQADLEDGQAAGFQGTPGFAVGVLNEDGTVVGKRINGAYPLTTFEELLGEYL